MSDPTTKPSLSKAPRKRPYDRTTGRGASSPRVSETIIHADGDCMDRIFETGHGHRSVGVGQRESLAAEVVVIILERCRPVSCECPLHAASDRPAGAGRGRAGVDGDPLDRGEGIVHLFVRPGGPALDVEEPAVNEAVAEPGGGRRQKVVADDEL